MRSHIFFKCVREQECTSGKWILQSLVKPEMMMELIDGVIPIGSQKWNLLHEKAACKLAIENSIQLTLSQCQPGEFTCHSGDCIPLEERCNINLNCNDLSDEYNCIGVKTGNQYAKELLPVSLNAEPCIIHINTSILSFPSISTKDLKFTADFYLNLRWHDLRISMLDLDHNYIKNRLSIEELDSLWMPKLAFVNSLDRLDSIRPSSGILVRESNPVIADISLPNEGNSYQTNRIHQAYILITFQHMCFLAKTTQFIFHNDTFKNFHVISY